VQSAWQVPLQQTLPPPQSVLSPTGTQLPVDGSHVWQVSQVTLSQDATHWQVSGSCTCPGSQVIGSQTHWQVLGSWCAFG
jgi:hypothetical protein